MAHIGKKIRLRRERLGWSLQKLATLSGKDASFISRVERELAGYSPETEELLAKTLNTTVSALHGGGSNVVEAPADHRRIPVLDYVRAGIFAFVDQRTTGDEMQDCIMTSLDHSSKAFALRIKGDSMQPEFRAGDLIVVDPAVKPMPGDYVVATNGTDEATFKKYRVAGTSPEGHEIFELVPLNPDYPSSRSDEHTLKVVGVMVEHRRPRRR